MAATVETHVRFESPQDTPPMATTTTHLSFESSPAGSPLENISQVATSHPNEFAREGNLQNDYLEGSPASNTE